MSRLAAFIALALSVAATAQPIYPVQQDRHVQAAVGERYEPNSPENVEEYNSAVGFDLWQADICAQSPTVPRAASAGQYSAVTAATIDAFGAADIIVTSGPNYGPLYFESAENRCQVRFAVPQRATVDLVGYVSLGGFADGTSSAWTLLLHANVELRQVAGPTLYANSIYLEMSSGEWSPELFTDMSVAFATELPPGVYELLVATDLHGEAWEGWDDYPLVSGEAGYVVSAEFAPTPAEDPSEADLDSDGDVDFADYARFQRAFTGPLLEPR
ncbi:MAG: hypothetical protein KA383_17515 [Phycisphaerae bacterium]|nr:hypothetical protein [Phycisphaerae bacterium]